MKKNRDNKLLICFAERIDKNGSTHTAAETCTPSSDVLGARSRKEKHLTQDRSNSKKTNCLTSRYKLLKSTLLSLLLHFFSQVPMPPERRDVPSGDLLV